MTDADGVPFGAGLCPEVAETHSGLVVLVGISHKVKKPIVTDFLDFSNVVGREAACAPRVMLSSRLSPDSYLGVAHFHSPRGGDPEPVIVMRRHQTTDGLATMVRRRQDVAGSWTPSPPSWPASTPVPTGAGRWTTRLASRPSVSAGGEPRRADPLCRRLRSRPGCREVADIERRVGAFLAGRAVLFARRIDERRIVDGHADLLADDIFCLPEAGAAGLPGVRRPAALRRRDRRRCLPGDGPRVSGPPGTRWGSCAGTPRWPVMTPRSRCGTSTSPTVPWSAPGRCVRYTQGHSAAAGEAAAHLRIAGEHLCAGVVRLIMVGGGPGTGKTTLARAIAEHHRGRLISTDDVRARMAARGEISGSPGVLAEGCTPGERRRGLCVRSATGAPEPVRGSYRDPGRHLARPGPAGSGTPGGRRGRRATGRDRLHRPLQAAAARIRTRTGTTSQVTPEIAAALAERDQLSWPDAHRVDTTKDPAESVAAALEICRTAR